MKYALAVNTVTLHVQENVNGMIKYIIKAGRNGAEMVIFPETAITGLCNTDITMHDLQLGLESDSAIISRISNQAKSSKVYVSLGLFEKCQGQLYDSAFCISPDGQIIAKYRRRSDGWHNSNADKNVYREGNEFTSFYVDGKKHSYLICGDLFNDELVNEVKRHRPDVLIIPFARTFHRGMPSQTRWDEEEMPYYIEQIRKSGTTTLMVNYLCPSDNTRDYYFGGAFAVNKEGTVIAQKDILSDGLLFVTI